MAWNKPNSNTVDATSSSRPSGRGKMPRLRRGLIAGVIVVLGAGLAAWLLANGEATSSSLQKKERGLIKEVTPAAAPTNRVVALNAEEKERLAHPGMVKSDTGIWQPTNRPWRAGRMKVHGVHTNGLRRAKVPLPYRNATEQLLYQTFSCELGSAPMPLAKISKHDLVKLTNSLIEDNPISKDDSEELAVGKDIVNAAKSELRKYIREGGDIDTFFEHYHRQLEQAYFKRRDAMSEIQRLAHDEADPDLARKFRDEINKKLIEEGIKPIKMEISDDPEDN